MKQPLKEFCYKYFWSKRGDGDHVVAPSSIEIQSPLDKISDEVWWTVCNRVWYGMAVNIHNRIEGEDETTT